MLGDLLEQVSEVADVDAARVHCLAQSVAVGDEDGVVEEVFDQRGNLNGEEELACLFQHVLVGLDQARLERSIQISLELRKAPLHGEMSTQLVAYVVGELDNRLEEIRIEANVELIGLPRSNVLAGALDEAAVLLAFNSKAFSLMLGFGF